MHVDMNLERENRPQEEIEALQRLSLVWRDTVWGLNGNPERADLAFEDIVERYRTGDGRAYHNIMHVDRMLAFVESFIHLSHNPAALVAAIFGHDIVYEPQSGMNELESANIFASILEALEVDEDQINEVKRLILLTKNHKTTDSDIDGKILIDSDYEILASPDEIYERYSQQGIYAEYVLSGKTPLEAYKRGRGLYLDGWIQDALNDRLFLNPEVMTAFKEQALKNFTRERLFLETL